MAPLLATLDGSECTTELVHTGQHYDDSWPDLLRRSSRLMAPDVGLGVGSGTHAEQAAGVLVGFERHLIGKTTDIVVVVGVSTPPSVRRSPHPRWGSRWLYVEAGLRSGDWSMPEEINRVLTDRLSQWLFTPSPDARRHLIAEGIERERIHFVGNIMIDTLLEFLPQARMRFEPLERRLGLPSRLRRGHAASSEQCR